MTTQISGTYLLSDEDQTKLRAIEFNASPQYYRKLKRLYKKEDKEQRKILRIVLV